MEAREEIGHELTLPENWAERAFVPVPPPTGERITGLLLGALTAQNPPRRVAHPPPLEVVALFEELAAAFLAFHGRRHPVTKSVWKVHQPREAPAEGCLCGHLAPRTKCRGISLGTLNLSGPALDPGPVLHAQPDAFQALGVL